MILWGAIPESIELGTTLTATVPGLGARPPRGVLGDLRRLGIESRRLDTPRDADIWWERQVP